MEQLSSHWTGFDENRYSTFFRKSVERIKVLSKSDKNNGYLAEFFLEWEVFQIEVVEKTKHTFYVQLTFFRKSCRLWYNVVTYGGARGCRWQYGGALRVGLVTL